MRPSPSNRNTAASTAYITFDHQRCHILSVRLNGGDDTKEFPPLCIYKVNPAGIPKQVPKKVPRGLGLGFLGGALAPDFRRVDPPDAHADFLTEKWMDAGQGEGAGVPIVTADPGHALKGYGPGGRGSAQDGEKKQDGQTQVEFHGHPFPGRTLT